MLVCHCAAVNDRRIRQAIARGADDLVAIADDCGAGSFCGGCQPTIEALLAEVADRPDETSWSTPRRGAAPATPTRVDAPTGRHARREPFRSVVRSIEEDVVAAGWVAGRSLGAMSELARRYGCTRATLTRAVWVLEQHGIVDVDDSGSGHVLLAVPDETAIAEAAALHLWSAGVTRAQLDRARRLIDATVARSPAAALGGAPANTALAMLARTLRHGSRLPRGVAVRRPTGPTSAMDLARAIAIEVRRDARSPSELVGTDRELRARYGTSADELRRAATLLEHYAVAHRRMGPDGGVVVSAPSPWPTARLLALHLEHAGLSADQLLEARAPFEVAAVEGASHRSDPVVRLFVGALGLVSVRTGPPRGASPQGVWQG